jgi:hypothetical protein
MRNIYKILAGNLEGDLGVDGRIVLNLISRKGSVRSVLD